MPIWLKVDVPWFPGLVRYPFVLGRSGFGCNQVEVRRNGTVLTPLPGSDWMRHGMLFSGNISGSYSSGRNVQERGVSRYTFCINSTSREPTKSATPCGANRRT